MSTMARPDHFQKTSGETDPVWIHTEPYSYRPSFPKLEENIETDVCIVGAGIAGIQTAYELVKRGHKVTMIEAREVLAGESGRTSGHLANALDDGYTNIAKKHGNDGAKLAAESHWWALKRVGEVAKELQISCEYRRLPGYEISQWEKSDPKHDEDVKMLKEEVCHDVVIQ
jgi:glycine/D-amino acid oxidase-like deaminating enzyme